MPRPLKAVISPDAIAANLELAAKKQPHAKLIAVMKANAYGHGTVLTARACEWADAYAVSCVDEAYDVRAITPDKPILLLEGFFDDVELPVIERLRLWPVVHCREQVEKLRKWPRIEVWLKFDTGMNRLGFRADELRRLVVANPVVGVLSHLSHADERDHPRTREQLAAATINARVSVSNSAGVLGWSGVDGEWIRSGLMLYGASPFPGTVGAEFGLRPAMTLESQLIAVRQCRAGDEVGYGGDWVCPEDMLVGTVAAGYGDGYPRHTPQGTPVLVNGRRAPLIGRVCMEMLMVDLRRNPNARVGDRVVLWGEGLPVEEIALHAGTIPNELLAGVTSRVPRVVHDNIA